MTPSAVVGRSGHVHELVLASSAADVVAAVVPFVLEGLAEESPTLLCLSPGSAGPVLDLFGGARGVTVLPYDPGPRRPGADLVRFHRLVRTVTSEGRQARVVNEIPPGLYQSWYQWCRYEAAVNVAHADLNAWGLCVYDERRLSAGMVEDLRATHPLIQNGVRHDVNPRYQDPHVFGRMHLDAPPDPVEATDPAVDLLDPTPAAARAAVRAFAGRGAGLPSEDLEGLVFATNEVVTNALTHGRPPVRLRLWAVPGRVVATVGDTGGGPEDGLVGLVQSRRGDGLWLSQQLVDVAHRRDDDGYTVRLTAALDG